MRYHLGGGIDSISISKSDPIADSTSGNEPILIAAAIVAVAAAIYTGSQTDWNVRAMIQAAGVAFITAAVGGSFATAGPVAALVGGAVAGAMAAGVYGGDIGQGALFGAIGAAVGCAFGGGIPKDILEFTARVAAAGVTSGLLAELSGAKFSQGAIPAMITAAAVSIAQIASKGSADKGVAQEDTSSKKATSDVTTNEGEVVLTANDQHGKGPLSSDDPAIRDAVSRAKENLQEGKDILRREIDQLKNRLEDASGKYRTQVLRRLEMLNAALKVLPRYFRSFIPMIVIIDPTTGLPVGMPGATREVLSIGV